MSSSTHHDLDSILKSSSAMNAVRIEAFLDESAIPLRLASAGGDGVPLVSSLWYQYSQGAFYSATHKSSLVAKRLLANPVCGFEIAADHMPYCGVRGQGRVEMLSDGASELLADLFERYHIDPTSHLATWLQSRSADEYVICIRPNWLTSWDYASRMTR